jgi:L-seryl-tRNA(Ser) seleniumtransferase
MLYPAVVHTLEQYDPARVRALVAATTAVGDELESRLPWVDRTPVAVKLQGEDTAQATGSALLPYEATAALAMLLLRDHGILTVHFAALPPGTSALLLKFVPPETLEAFGGAARFAEAVESSLAELAELAGDEPALRELLGVGRPVTA